MSFENFLADYTEVDPNEKITLTSTKTAFDNITDGDDAYVYRDKGEDFFSGAYKHLLEIKYTSGTNTPAAFWALTNILNDLKYIDDVGDYWEGLYRGVTNSLILARVNAGARVTDVWTGWDTGVTYYVTIERTAGGVLTAEIRTGSHEGVLQDTLQVTGATTAYRYIHSYNHLRTVSGNYCSGFTQNLDLGGVEPILLAGTAAIQSTTSGVIKITRKIAGTAAIASTTSGSLTKITIKLLAGTAAIQSTATGTVKVELGLAGTAVITCTAVALVQVYKGLAGTAAIQCTTQGITKVVRKLAGTASIQSTTSGVIKLTQNLIGTVEITCTTSGNLTWLGVKTLIGTAAIQCTAVGALTRIGIRELAGTAVITCTAIGILTTAGEKLLAGTSVIKSSATGILVVYYGYRLLPPFMEKDVIDPYSGGAWLWLVEIIIPTQTTQRIARNPADVRYGGKDFIKSNFDPPSRISLVGDGSIPRIQLQVAQDGTGVLENIVNATKGGENGTIKIIRTCEKFLEMPAAALEATYDILTAGSDYQWITFILGIPNLLTQRIPLWSYSSKVCPLATPSLFKGPRCQYPGPDPVCTGLFEDCYTKGNAVHWGAELGLDPNAVKV